MADAVSDTTHKLPFDAARLDQLLDDKGIDILLVTSKHDIQYLLGGYRFFFFDYMDAIGISRYLPILIYPKGKPENAVYIGNRLEVFEKQLDRFWTPVAEMASSGSADAIQVAVEHVRKLVGPHGRLGIEPPFLPSDSAAILRAGMGDCEIVDAQRPLELLRSRKSPAELKLIRAASELVVESMRATFGHCRPGITKRDLVETLRREEVNRGLTFEYCLISAGTSLNRAPSNQVLAQGDIFALDSGGNFKGYIGDLCSMGILGEPDAELEDLLGVIDAIQMKARRPIRPGARGGDIFVAARELVEASPHRDYLEFVAHGMGLVSHEAPRLTSQGPVEYPGDDEGLRLESGMVISIETAMLHPRRGFIKLEDTVVVTDHGHDAFGDSARDWNRAL